MLKRAVTKTKRFVFSNRPARANDRLQARRKQRTLEMQTCYHRFVYFDRRITRTTMRSPDPPDSRRTRR